MANKGSESGLGATAAGQKPGDYPLGSAESRAAARARLQERFGEQKTEEFILIRGKYNPHGLTTMHIIPPGTPIADVERLRAQEEGEWPEDWS